MNKSINELKKMLPYYQEQFDKYFCGPCQDLEDNAFRDLTFLENKIKNFS